MHSKPVQAGLLLYPSFLDITRIWQYMLLMAVKGKGNLLYCSKSVCVQLRGGGSELHVARYIVQSEIYAHDICMRGPQAAESIG